VPPVEAPLANNELEALFAPFAKASRIALAVSGGGDSLALLDAFDRWRRRRSRPGVIVLTVDHRLRRGSTAEAATVAKIAGKRGMTARVLTWKGPKPKSDIEGSARSARYRLLVDACHQEGASHLILAHHQDDLAETFLLRLQRGAGVFGLAAMRPVHRVGDVTIVRPLLGVPRARLAATTAAAKLKATDDPMNSDSRFDRVRVRRLMPMLAGEGLHAPSIAAAALRLVDAADAIDAIATALLADAVTVDAMAVVWLDASRFTNAPIEVRMRTLTRLLLVLGGEDYPPRHERLAALADVICAHDERARFKRTLAGTVVESREGRIAFYRESGRVGLPTVKVKAGFAGVWDHRFAVEVGKGAPAGLTLGPLGEAGRRELGTTAGIHPAGALAVLPAIRRNGKVVAVPSLQPLEGFPAAVRPIVAERLQLPPLFPDLALGR
jgi:tRNA(Ile)-lysidine synthase